MKLAKQNLPPNVADRPLVIYAMGNGMEMARSARYIAFLIDQIGSDGMAFNYRGVGNSGKLTEGGDNSAIEDTAEGFGDLVEDLKGAVEHAHKLGYSYENITIYGHSLGGAVGVSTAKQYHDFGVQIRVIAGRTFEKLSDVVKYTMTYGLVPSGLIDQFIPKEWNSGSISEKYESIPTNCRLAFNSRHDALIKWDASLVAGIRKRSRNVNQYIETGLKIAPMPDDSEVSGDQVNVKGIGIWDTDAFEVYGLRGGDINYHNEPETFFCHNEYSTINWTGPRSELEESPINKELDSFNLEDMDYFDELNFDMEQSSLVQSMRNFALKPIGEIKSKGQLKAKEQKITLSPTQPPATRHLHWRFFTPMSVSSLQ